MRCCRSTGSGMRVAMPARLRSVALWQVAHGAFAVEVGLAGLGIADDDVADREQRRAAHGVVDALAQEVAPEPTTSSSVNEALGFWLCVGWPAFRNGPSDAARHGGAAVEIHDLGPDDVRTGVRPSRLRAVAVDAVARPQRAAAIVRRLVDDRRSRDLRHRRRRRRRRAAAALAGARRRGRRPAPAPRSGPRHTTRAAIPSEIFLKHSRYRIGAPPNRVMLNSHHRDGLAPGRRAPVHQEPRHRAPHLQPARRGRGHRARLRAAAARSAPSSRPSESPASAVP